MTELGMKFVELLPRSLRARLRHWHYVFTNKRPAYHYEVAEREEFFRRAMKMLAFNGISGDYAEFGCHGGMTFGLAHKYIRTCGKPRHQWAFDSFKGLPRSVDAMDEHPVWVEGEMCTSLQDFTKECRRVGIAGSEMSVVEGYYKDTIGKVDHSGPLPTNIAFAYIDCDLFSSTVTVLAFLKLRMKHGMVVAFDDYFCLSATALAGERAAMIEFLTSEDRFDFLPYQAYGWHGMSFVVEDKRLRDLQHAHL